MPYLFHILIVMEQDALFATMNMHKNQQVVQNMIVKSP